MEDTRGWRRSARFVAWVDMIFTVFGLIIVILTALGIGVVTVLAVFQPVPLSPDSVNMTQLLTEYNVTDETEKLDIFSRGNMTRNGTEIDVDVDADEDSKEISNLDIWTLWSILVVMALMTLLQFWAAMKLMLATKIGRDPQEAWDLATIWRNVCVFFIFIEILCDLIMKQYISLGVVLIIRIAFLLVVHKFRKELEIEIAAVK